MADQILSTLYPQRGDSELTLLARIAARGAGLAVGTSAANLTATVPAGHLMDAAGNTLAIAAQSLTLQASMTQYVVATLESGECFVVRRAYHDGCVVLAEITTDATGTTAIKSPNEFRLPPGKVERTKAKLRNGEAVNVLILGTSLMNYTLGAPNVTFKNLLFNSSYSANGYNVPGVAGVTVLHYSQGSTGPHFSWGMVARPVASVPNTAAADTRALGIKCGPAQMPNLTVQANVGENYLATLPDLVIVDGYNYGQYLLGTLESQLRYLKKQGVEVILMCSGPNTSNESFRYDQGDGMKSICEANGFAFCDLNAFQRSELEIGNNTALFDDGVHPSTTGNEFYAARLRDLLNDWHQAPALAEVPRLPAYRQEVGASYRKRFPELAEIFVDHVRTTGTANSAVLASSAAATVNPLIVTGHKTSSTTITVLTPGQYILVGHPLALAYDLMLEIDPGVNADVDLKREAGATLIKNVTATYGVGNYAKQAHILELFSVDEVLNTYSAGLQLNWFGYTAAPFGNNLLRVENGDPANNLRVIAPIVHTVRHREVGHFEWARGATGTWAEENCYWTTGAYKILYCDTTNATLTLSYFGRGICLVFQGGSSCGQISIKHDGVETTKDLYSASSTAFQYYLAAPQVEAAGGEWAVAGRWHTVRIALTGVNGSAGASSAGLRRLALVAAYIIEE